MIQGCPNTLWVVCAIIGVINILSNIAWLSVLGAQGKHVGIGQIIGIIISFIIGFALICIGFTCHRSVESTSEVLTDHGNGLNTASRRTGNPSTVFGAGMQRQSAPYRATPSYPTAAIQPQRAPYRVTPSYPSAAVPQSGDCRVPQGIPYSPGASGSLDQEAPSHHHLGYPAGLPSSNNYQHAQITCTGSPLDYTDHMEMQPSFAGRGAGTSQYDR